MQRSPFPPLENPHLRVLFQEFLDQELDRYKFTNLLAFSQSAPVTTLMGQRIHNSRNSPSERRLNKGAGRKSAIEESCGGS